MDATLDIEYARFEGASSDAQEAVLSAPHRSTSASEMRRCAVQRRRDTLSDVPHAFRRPGHGHRPERGAGSVAHCGGNSNGRGSPTGLVIIVHRIALALHSLDLIRQGEQAGHLSVG